jgi:hypothetical protein
MTAFTDSLGFNKGTAAFPADVTAVSKFEVKVDLAAIIAARSAAGATALAAGDSLEIISLPAGSVVLSAGCQVIEAETTNTTGTYSLGNTGGTTNLYTNALANNSLGYGITNLANPTVYGTADTIDLLLNTAVGTNGVVNVFAIVANVSSTNAA